MAAGRSGSVRQDLRKGGGEGCVLTHGDCSASLT